MKRVLCLDFDDTLVPFVRGWLTWLRVNKLTNHQFQPEDVAHYHWFSEQFGPKASQYFLRSPANLYGSMRPIPGATQFLLWAQELFDLHSMTHASGPGTTEAKSKFITEHFHPYGIDIKIDFFDHMDEKYKSTKGILIDDYPKHILNHIAYNKEPAILFDYEGKNGWSKLRNYTEQIEKVKPNFELYHYATSYEEIQDILLKLTNQTPSCIVKE